MTPAPASTLEQNEIFKELWELHDELTDENNHLSWEEICGTLEDIAEHSKIHDAAISRAAVDAATLAAYQEVEKLVLSCIWSDAPDCPGAKDGECICDGCEYYEFINPEDFRNIVKEKMDGLRRHAPKQEREQ
jgi:hypothetical protein